MSPECGGGPNYVYRLYDDVGRLIYVGTTGNPAARIRGHRQSSWWGDQIATTRLIVWPDRQTALAKERTAIAIEQPRWNVRGRWHYRTNWVGQDYVDYLTAIRRGATMIGTNSAKHIADVEAELAGLAVSA